MGHFLNIAMGADYAFHVKIIETYARAFLALNILAIGRVGSQRCNQKVYMKRTLDAIHELVIKRRKQKKRTRNKTR